MASTRRCLSVLLLLSLIIHCSGASFNRSDAPADYIISVIKHLEATVVGSYSCVFYRMLEMDDIAQDVLRAPELDSVPKLVITGSVADWTLSRLPADNLLIVLEAKGLAKILSAFRTVMRAFGPNSRILVLGDSISGDVRFFELVVKQLSICNVVYLDVKRRRMFAVDVVKKVRLNYQEDPSRLWNGSMMRNMRGRPVTYMNKKTVSAIRPVRKWLLETASLMNTTVKRSVQKCPATNLTIIRDDCYRMHFFKNNVDIDLELYHIYSFGDLSLLFLFTGLTDDMSILVPRSQLTMVQLFFSPFDWEVWVLIGSILAATELLRILFPSHFRNDPILLVVCGFERYDLHTAGRWEKLILLSVMQMIFFTTCAYETKLLAMMVAKPAAQELNTLDEFIESGIKIKVNFLGHTDHDKSYPSLSHLMVNSTDSIRNLDTAHAYIVEREVAELVLPRYYDPVQRLNRYSILEQSLGMVVRLYMIHPRTPFKPVLEFTNAALIQAGILTNYWPMLLQLKSTDQILDPPEEVEEVLFFDDLLPAWIALGVGLSLSSVLYGAEICMKVFLHHNGKRNGRTV